MIGYVIVGVIAFAVGEIVGVFVASLGQAAKERDELGKFSDDLCHGCFGASVGDCDHCMRKDGKQDDETT